MKTTLQLLAYLKEHNIKHTIINQQNVSLIKIQTNKPYSYINQLIDSHKKTIDKINIDVDIGGYTVLIHH